MIDYKYKHIYFFFETSFIQIKKLNILKKILNSNILIYNKLYFIKIGL